jgi:hypothetical protein
MGAYAPPFRTWAMMRKALKVRPPSIERLKAIPSGRLLLHTT